MGFSNSGICLKFIPYQPTKMVKGMQQVVTVVKTAIFLFWRISNYDLANSLI
ncbi:hypothetical protein SuUB36_02870 [Streptococcus uberis]